MRGGPSLIIIFFFPPFPSLLFFLVFTCSWIFRRLLPFVRAHSSLPITHTQLNNMQSIAGRRWVCRFVYNQYFFFFFCVSLMSMFCKKRYKNDRLILQKESG
ncbi:hypothetical protein EDD21DRAFT_361723 [Dissophora ornata]|nr:hypothetical protein EDD21DRAFT_361723 [Dissophora ornata]